MNKFLLSCAVGALASVSAFGADFSFGYCTGDDILGTLSENMPDIWIAAAIKIPGQEILDTYGEVTLTQVSVGLGKTANPDIELFLSYGPQLDPFYTQNAKGVSKEFTTITLDQPYTITDKDLYLGYIVKTKEADEYPIGTDKSESPVKDASFYYASTDRAKLFDPESAQNITSFGNLCIRGVFSVNKADYVNPLNVTLPYVVKPEEAFSATLSFTNLGTNQVNAITIKSQIGDEPEVLYDINFPDVLPGRESQINIEGLKATSVAENAPVSMEIVKVNGADNAMPVKVVTGTVHVMSEYYNRPVVIEEGTGTTCGFCPRGYLGMEYMREKYNSSEFIGIAAHIYSDKDPMWCGSYKSAESIFIAPGAYLANYPCATVNRTTVFDPSPDDCQLQYDAQEKIAFRKVDFTARYTNPHYEELEVMCEITSATDLESHNLGLSVVTVEDGVGPYQQLNNFAGGRYGEMGDFEKKPTLVELTFNDVARTIVNWNGNAQVMPETLTAGVPAKAESLYITTDRIKDLKNSFIVVLLIDKKNGRIVNAHRIAMPDAVIENVDPASAKVVLADNADAEFYTLDGLRVTDEYLAPGLYIKRQNGKSEKILVK